MIAAPEDHRFRMLPRCGIAQVPTSIRTCALRGGRRGARFCGLTAPSRIRRSGIISLVKNEQPASGKHILEMKIECGIHRKISFEKKFSYLRPRPNARRGRLSGLIKNHRPPRSAYISAYGTGSSRDAPRGRRGRCPAPRSVIGIINLA
jgi:hypothetical protein